MTAYRATALRSPVAGRPIIDSTIRDRMQLLNANNYQKGAWVLHTLRGLMGDSAFFRGVRRYYHAFEHGTALSQDLVTIMSEEAGTDLGWYFTQSLTQPGYPILRVSTALAGGHATVRLEQVQPAAWGVFQLPDFEIRVGGRTIVVPITERTGRTVFHWEGRTPPVVELDPRGRWLFDVQAADGR